MKSINHKMENSRSQKIKINVLKEYPSRIETVSRCDINTTEQETQVKKWL